MWTSQLFELISIHLQVTLDLLSKRQGWQTCLSSTSVGFHWIVKPDYLVKIQKIVFVKYHVWFLFAEHFDQIEMMFAELSPG